MPATFGGRQLLDPTLLRLECQDGGVPTDPWFGLANSYRHPLGEKPGTADLLMRRSELNRLSLTDAGGLTLEFRDQDNRSIAPRKLTVLSVTAVTPGAPNDPAAAVYLKVADRRHHLARVPTDRAFNVRDAGGTGYLCATLNGGVPWTWEQLLTRLWDDLRAAFADLPAWPGLPFTPQGTPENFDFYGGFAWPALNKVLGRLACAVRYDPTTDPGTGTWTVVQLGANDAAATAAIAALGGVRDWDDEPVDPARAWWPEKVRVLFRRRPAPSDGSNPFYEVDVTLVSAAGVVPGTYVILADDLTALGAYGTPSNDADLQARASERATDWLRQRGGWGNPKLKQWLGARTEVRAILGKTTAEWSVEDRGRGVLTAIAARPAELGFGLGELTGAGGASGVTVCGSPVVPPWAAPADTRCPACSLGQNDVATHRGVTGFKFKECDFVVTATGACGGSGGGSGQSVCGTGSGSGSGGADGDTVQIRLAGKTEVVEVVRGGVFCPDTCDIVFEYRYLCFQDGLEFGHFDGPDATCGSGSGSSGGTGLGGA